jgi:hypothetical protein
VEGQVSQGKGVNGFECTWGVEKKVDQVERGGRGERVKVSAVPGAGKLVYSLT